MNLRHLLAGVTADVGWIIDFDELVVTAAQRPDLVTTLIATACQYQAHTLTAPVLSDAQTLLRDLLDGGGGTVDLEGQMLSDVHHHAERERLSRQQARQRLLAALGRLHGDAAWPHTDQDAPGGDALAVALTALGLSPSNDDASRYEFGAGCHHVTVLAGAHQPVSVTVSHEDRVSWSATLHPATPVPVIVAAVAQALTAPAAADPAGPLVWAPGFVRLPGLTGPYPALLADPLTADRRPESEHLWARVTAETITRIADDRAALPEPEQDANLPGVRLVHGTAEVRHPSSAGGTNEVIHPDAAGLYLLSGWPWQPADPPQPPA